MKALSVNKYMSIKFNTMNFEGKWKSSFGTPQLGGSWIIYGMSSTGKTALCIQLAKYLTQFGTVLYDTFEEEVSMSFQDSLIQFQMNEVNGKFSILPGETLTDLNIRLSNRRSADIIFIDSIQHSFIDKKYYRLLKKRFPNKLFIYVSHAKGNEPKGDVADFIRYDSDLKIHVKDFRAFPSGRISNSNGDYFDIYPEKSKTLWNEAN